MNRECYLGLTQLICLAAGGPTSIGVMREIPSDSKIMSRVDSIGVNDDRGHEIETPAREGVHHSHRGLPCISICTIFVL